MRKLRPGLLTLAAPVFLLSQPGSAADPLQFPTTPPTEAQDAAKTFHVLDGFQMQLIAAEPLVTDPVAVTYDADGRAYVCEMNDYPYTDKAAHKPSQENPTDQPLGKVRLLTDTDGDGVFDKATVFAEGLSWPTGAACWKGGIFVTATPDVWYLKDTNGDGVADVRQKVFTGFKKLNVQAVMNNPAWGLDHRIYVAGGSNGGEIQRAPGSEGVMPLPPDFKPLPIKRHDFSFDPATGDVRLESGGARFGNTFDDWGNRFLCNIRNPCQHVVLPYRYLARNPYLVVPTALNDCAEAGDQLPVYRTSPPEPWREFRAKRWVQEGSHLPKSELVGAGVVTSSAGITVYRGDAYPQRYRDFAFVADVAGNLFYRMKLVPDGVTFKAVQVDGNKNFCTSDDLWFRPVNFVNAPDGCLHVCDMYREVIEHPWSIPDDIHAAVDLLRGRDKGRLFRLAPAAFKPRPTPALSAAPTAELVALLDHPNAWHRETAQRLLYERQEKSTLRPLRALVENATTPQGRLCAAWALDGVHAPFALRWGVVSEQLLRHDPAPQMRAAAGLLLWDMTASCEPSQADILQHTALSMAAMQKKETALSLGIAMTLTTVTARDKLAPPLVNFMRHASRDPWLRPVLLHAAMAANPVQVAMLLGDSPQDEKNPRSNRDAVDGRQLLAALGELIMSKGSPEQREEAVRLEKELAMDNGMPMSPEALTLFTQGLAKGAFMRGLTLADLSQDPAVAQAWATRAQAVMQSLRDSSQSVETRTALFYQAWFGGQESVEPLLAALLSPDQPAELQLALLDALNHRQEPAVADLVIKLWPRLTPALRDKATALLLSRTDRIAKLLDAIEAKKITPAQLSAAAKATLGRQKTPALAERIARLVGDGASANRKEVIAKYASVMTLAGDAARGTKVYETACMVCHRHKDRGNDVGPNLGTIQGWTAEQLVTNILDPNREVSPNFALYLVETRDGRALSGLITSETAGNLTLRRADGGSDTVLRGEIKSLTSPGISLMPEGLEAAITPQQMADLIAYLKGG